MNRNKFLATIILSAVILASCKKQLDIRNPNQPTPESAATEQGVVSLAQGGVYVNGFRDLKYGDGVFGLYWSGAMGFHELMADVIQAEAANSFLNQIGCPDSVIFTGGQVLLNPNSPKRYLDFIRQTNVNANQGSNFTYYEWAYMYSMINAMNSVLDVVEKVAFSGNAAVKKATVQAWAHYWKGFAYARIGSIYYAGLINNSALGTNGNYVTKEAIITESNSELDKAAALLTSTTADYTTILGKLIPSFNQTGKGGVLTTDEWKHSINTLKARNILVNKRVTQMTPADWNAILTLTSNGISATDHVFTGRSNATGDFLSSGGNGTVSGKVQHNQAGGNTYKLSERWVQDFLDTTNDKRFKNNVKKTVTWIGNSDRGQAFNTRYTLVNGGLGMAGVKVYANIAVGAYELFLAGNFEENALMRAEALIYTGQIDQGLQLIDAVRTYQGAGLAAVGGTGLTQAQAVVQLRSERRVALPFIGLSFYDARRWGVIYPRAEGGGRTPAVVVKFDGSVDYTATIVYQYLDYWDVPDNEIAYNAPAAGSAPIKNPRQ